MEKNLFKDTLRVNVISELLEKIWPILILLSIYYFALKK